MRIQYCATSTIRNIELKYIFIKMYIKYPKTHYHYCFLFSCTVSNLHNTNHGTYNKIVFIIGLAGIKTQQSQIIIEISQ